VSQVRDLYGLPKLEDRPCRRYLKESGCQYTRLTDTLILLFFRSNFNNDPFVGSGTTIVAAIDCDCNAVGFDLKDDYVSLSNKRKEIAVFS